MLARDRFLLGIVLFIVALVVTAFALALRVLTPEYRTGTEPEDIAYNYTFALLERDYDKAYGLLSPDLRVYPESLEQFVDDVDRYSYIGPADVATIRVDNMSIAGDRAVVTLRQTEFSGGGLFDSSQYTSDFDVRLDRTPQGWRVIHSGMYWVECWDNPDRCSGFRQPEPDLEAP